MNLKEITDLYKICKPYISIPFEPYIIADNIYTVSKERANKVYKIFCGIDCKNLDDEVQINMVIASGFLKNSCESFFKMMGDMQNGNN